MAFNARFRNVLQLFANRRFLQTSTVGKGRFDASSVHPYRRLFPWKSLSEFVDTLEESVVFNDGKVIGICKPWGVGIHKPDVVVNKKRTHLLLSEVIGHSKYCVDDALPVLAERLRLPELILTKSVDRHMSGVMLFTSSRDLFKRVIKAIKRAKAFQIRYLSYWCITKGYPLIDGEIKEKVGIKLVEIDEFGDHKEPHIVPKPSVRSIKSKIVRSIQCGMSVKALNKEISSSLLEVNTISNKWDFVRTYVSSKTSFILGDVRMAQRVRQVLGVPLQLSPHNVGYYDDYEPLPSEIRKRLRVEGNRKIPLMVHLRAITLPRFGKNQTDLVIQSKRLPNHFLWTLQELDLQNGLNEINDTNV